MRAISRSLSPLFRAAAYRYERKFRISRVAEQDIDAAVKLHPSMFSDLYYPRYVNNIYFDTRDRSGYDESVSGDPERLKVRIRWYGDLLGNVENPALELKRKSSVLGEKLLFPLPSYSSHDLSIDRIRDVFRQADLPEILRQEVLTLDFALLNRYRRRYYRCADGTYRITLDTEQEYYRLAPLGSPCIGKATDDEAVILELKYAESEDDGARNITRHLPFRVTRSSKFVNGMHLLYA